MTTNKIGYYKIDKEIRKACQKAEGKHVNEEYTVIEDLEKKNQRLIHEKVKEATNREKKWEEYIKELFEDNRKSVTEIK